MFRLAQQIRPRKIVQTRSLHPLLWAGALLAKKSIVYKAASTYGYPRIYKRLLEQTKIHVEPATRPHVNHLIKTSIRAPTQAYAAVMDTEVHRAITKIIAAGDNTAQTNLPPFMYTLLETAVEGLLPVKATRDVQKAAHTLKKKRTTASPPPPPPPRSNTNTNTNTTTRSFSSSPSPMSTSTFLKREVKILFGVAIGTVAAVYLYNKYNEDGIHDLTAAKQRYNLAERAVAANQKGAFREAITLYEELLSNQRTLIITRAKHNNGQGEMEVNKFDAEPQILSELGEKQM